jgi:hypothetical protein
MGWISLLRNTGTVQSADWLPVHMGAADCGVRVVEFQSI